MKTILVAGRSGQVAQALAEQGPSHGVKIVCMGRPGLDITDPGSIAQAIAKVRPDCLINAAAYTAVDLAETETGEAFRVNAEAAGHLASAAAEAGLPILHLSTDYVFDGTKASPYIETDPVNPSGVYGASKLQGERAVAEANTNHLIARTAWVYSPFGKNFIKTMLRLAGTHEKVRVVADQIGNPTSAFDIADALLNIVSQIGPDNRLPTPGLFHLSGTGEASWADFAEFIFEASAAAGGPAVPVERITTAEFPTPASRPANSRLDCSKLAKTYAITLPDWRSSAGPCIRRIVETKD